MTGRTDLDRLVELDPTRSKSSLGETALSLDDEADDGTECQTRLEDRRRGVIREPPTRRRADKNVCELVGLYIGMIGEGSVLALDADTRPGGLPDLGTLAAAYLRCEVGPVFHEHGGWDGPDRDTQDRLIPLRIKHLATDCEDRLTCTDPRWSLFFEARAATQ